MSGTHTALFRAGHDVEVYYPNLIIVVTTKLIDRHLGDVRCELDKINDRGLIPLPSMCPESNLEMNPSI